ncbi:MAG: T9SS type A sorting domain-containing protein, partial [Opitutaceae bacterium]|nr:T9SS type A sorting domain-containing protein [Cytophagales bacterium]
ISPTINTSFGLISNEFAVTASKTYRLNFSMTGSKNEIPLKYTIRKNGDDFRLYSDAVTERASSIREDYSMLFQSTVTANDARLDIQFKQMDGSFWIDKVVLQRATFATVNPNDSITLLTNPTSNIVRKYLSACYIDARKNEYTEVVELKPFTSILLFKLKKCSIPSSTVTSNKMQSDNLHESEIIIYPNPSNNFYNLKEEFKNCRIEIFSMQGINIASYCNGAEFGSELHQGTYVAQIHHLNGTVKFIKIIKTK